MRAWWFLAAAAVALVAAPDSSKTVNDGYGDYVLVPAGPFRMGDTFKEGNSRELPVHTVELNAYYIGKYLVTNGEFRKFRDDPGYDDPKFWPGGKPIDKSLMIYWNNAQYHGGGTPDSDAYPVTGPTWEHAMAYCNWLSAKTGKRYRLPTEAEWEKAARGTDGRRYAWGNNIDGTYANYWEYSRSDQGVPTPVGFFDGTKRGEMQTHNGASPYGAFDMTGNLHQWCSDYYSRNYYASSPRKNPKGPASGAYRVLRGGTYRRSAWEVRAAARYSAYQAFQSNHFVGFRCVREP
jgi:formylglycine-generating enzyme required for sulfatase activity